MNQWNFIFSALEATELWLSQPPTPGDALSGFARFAQLAVSFFCETRPDSPVQVSLFVQTVISASDPFLCDEQALFEKINTKSNGRSFRVAAALARRPGKTTANKRLCDMVFLLAQNMSIPFSCNALLCPLFTDIGTNRSKGCAVLGLFAFAQSTCFQQSLFVSAVVRAQLAVDSSSKKIYNKSDGLSISASVVDLTKMTHRISQRIGWGIQVIVLRWGIKVVGLGWGSFASGLGFADIETMLQPFLYFSATSAQFQVLSNGEAGFVSADYVEGRTENFVPTNDPSKSFPLVHSLPAPVDTALRTFGGDF